MQLSIDRRLLAALAAAIIAALSWWLLSSIEEERQRFARDAESRVDYYLSDFTLTGMGVTGAPEHRLVADSLIHYADDDTARVTVPRVTILRPDGMPWEVNAAEGWLTSGQQQLLLRGEVHIQRRPGPDNSAVEIETDELTVHLEDEYAETDRPVTIRHEQGVTDAVGMTASLREGRLRLLSQVRGLYVLEPN